MDVATPSLCEALRFIGVTDVRFVLIRPTAGPVEPIRAPRENVHRLAGMAARF
jgi:FMN-dependent NADH-azoreductase